MIGQTEDAEVIDAMLQRYVVRLIQRQKYRCKCQGAIVTAPAPTKHVAKGRYTLDFGAHIVAQKYAFHMPLARLVKAMADEGLTITTQTLWDQVLAIAETLEPVYDLLKEHILGSDVIGIDETWWRLMDKKASKKWWVWAMQSGDAVYFHASHSRSAQVAIGLVEGFEGTMISDGYKAYETLAKAKRQNKKELFLAMCWAHVRRKFIEAEPDHPECAAAIELIGLLYELDRESVDPSLLEGDEKSLAEDVRRTIRAERAPPILEKLKAWAYEQRGLPKSRLRTAIDYMLGHWNALVRFVDDPYVPLDNNAIERALRGIVVGRKNHYGSRSERGTKVAAVLYSLIETAKLNGISPQAYITAAVHGIEMGIEPRRLLPLRELWQEQELK